MTNFEKRLEVALNKRYNIPNYVEHVDPLLNFLYSSIDDLLVNSAIATSEINIVAENSDLLCCYYTNEHTKLTVVEHYSLSSRGIKIDIASLISRLFHRYKYSRLMNIYYNKKEHTIKIKYLQLGQKED